MKTKYEANTSEFEYDELKPCPFCGHTADYYFKGNNYTKRIECKIKCDNKFCRATIVSATLRNNEEWIGICSIDIWNSRITK